MSNFRNLMLLGLSWLCLNNFASAQNMVSIDEVLTAVDENNFDLQAARQNIAAAEVLTSKYNRGYRPTLGLNAGLAYNLSGIKSVFNFNFPDLDIQNIQAGRGNAGVSSTYLLYDNGQRKLLNEKNETNLDFANLQLANVQQLIRFNASQLYYNIAQAVYNTELLSESLAISQERISRAQTYYEYGKVNRVDVLNAEVDVARDSLNLISVENDIENLKWQLNQLTLRADTDYVVDTSFTLLYQLALLPDLQSELLGGNAELSALRKNTELVEFDAALAKKLNGPTIQANGAYDFNYQKNSEKAQQDFTRTNGLNLGLGASWNIFDGGQRKVQQQLVAIEAQNVLTSLRNKENELSTQLNRLWNSYQNSLLTLRIEQQNIVTNQVNFELVKSLYENGQQSSVEFRQAQVNLINAQSQYYFARTSAKLLELEMDYLLGR